MTQNKENAASAALEEVRDGMVLGLGTGSTTALFLERLAEKARDEDLELCGVPTSIQTAHLATRLGIRLVALNEVDVVDLAVDGCDEFDANLDLIKGRGGAMVREKVVDYAAKRLVILANGPKRVEQLGGLVPVPVEVLPFAWAAVAREIDELGAEWDLREGTAKDGPVVTDNGNLILDTRFGLIDDPAALEHRLAIIPGVVGSGLFTGHVDIVYCGTNEGVDVIKR
mgnify:FL=1